MTKTQMKALYNQHAEVDKQTDATVAELQELWMETIPLCVPDDKQFLLWLYMFSQDPRPIIYGMSRAAARMRHSEWNDEKHHLAFISAVALTYFNDEKKAA
jgi:hypothetical protein